MQRKVALGGTMKRRTALLVVASALTLAACASPRKPDLTLPAAFEAPSAAAPAAQAAAVNLDRWWEVFGDAQLNSLIDTALTRSPDARTALAQLEQARAVRQGQRAQLYIPSGALAGSASRRNTTILDGAQIDFPGFRNSGNADSQSLNFDVSWELDLYGRRRAANQRVNGDFAAARFSYEAARASLAASVAQSYFEARGLAIQLEDARITAGLQKRTYDLADARGKRGLVATSEGDRVAGDLAQAEAQAAALEAQLQAAKRTLLILTGRGVEPTASLTTEPNVGVAPAVPATVPGDLLERRPDVRQAQARLTAAAGNLRVAELARFPTFTLAPGIGLSRSEQPGFSSTTRIWTLAGSLNVPVFDQVRLAAEVKNYSAQAEQAVIAYEKAVQTAYGEAENSLVQLSADQRRVVLLRDGEARARRAYDAGRKGYDLGLNDLSTLIQSEQGWRAARSAYTGAQVQALTRAVQAYKALGGGWSPSNPASETASR
ncbi:MAG: transporter [Caulobacterales bacterium 68-7]|nr:efflux transporter outer membrane subunit [Caulobacterales bacterium]OJU10630.1 MAG: transporter [Caulobacterales bacterium 68-7]